MYLKRRIRYQVRRPYVKVRDEVLWLQYRWKVGWRPLRGYPPLTREERLALGEIELANMQRRSREMHLRHAEERRIALGALNYATARAAGVIRPQPSPYQYDDGYFAVQSVERMADMAGPYKEVHDR